MYNDHHKDHDFKPHQYNHYGQTQITNAIKHDLQYVPPWLIVKYIQKIQGEMYFLNRADVIRLEKEGRITLVRQK
jgi:hypothetical protein